MKKNKIICYGATSRKQAVRISQYLFRSEISNTKDELPLLLPKFQDVGYAVYDNLTGVILKVFDKEISAKLWRDSINKDRGNNSVDYMRVEIL